MAHLKSIRIKNLGDFILGLVFVFFAGVALFLLRDLHAGTTSQMGAAYFPRMLAVIMLLLGAAIVFKSFVTEGQHQLHIRPLPVIFVVVGTVFFGLAAARLGGLLTIFGMVVIYSFAYPGRRIRETLFLAIGSAICASVLFIEVLGLPLPMWPRFWGG